LTTPALASAEHWTTAIRCVASSLHQHQKLTHTERGDSWGLCAPIPAVVYDDTQAYELGRGVDPRSFSRNSHWLPSSLAADWRAHQITLLLGCVRHNSPAARHSAERGAFHSVRFSDCRPSALNTCRHQRLVNNRAERLHLSINLSKSGSSAGSINASKQGQGLGNFIRQRGTFVQGTRRHD
jgi:hypothetical protein